MYHDFLRFFFEWAFVIAGADENGSAAIRLRVCKCVLAAVGRLSALSEEDLNLLSMSSLLESSS